MLTLIFHSYRHQNSFLCRKLLGSPRINRTELQERKANPDLVIEHLKPQLSSKEESALVTSPSCGQGAETESQTNVTPGTAGIQTTQHPGLGAYSALIRAGLSIRGTPSPHGRPHRLDSGATTSRTPGHPISSAPQSARLPEGNSSTAPRARLCLLSIFWWVTCP